MSLLDESWAPHDLKGPATRPSSHTPPSAPSLCNTALPNTPLRAHFPLSQSLFRTPSFDAPNHGTHLPQDFQQRPARPEQPFYDDDHDHDDKLPILGNGTLAGGHNGGV